MSLWKSTDPLIGMVIGGAIFDRYGMVWSSTPGFYPLQSDLVSLIEAYNPNSHGKYKGIYFQGEKYAIINIFNNVMVGKKNCKNFVVVKCTNFYVVGFNDMQISFENCYNAVVSLASSLENSNNIF